MDWVLGTAGHIDHGKTSLVRALTGINCDRLDEERRRGITIELGFAWLDMPDGRRLGIVDVPGHERFVKNMVAGAAGIDCMLLVIAADEGVMPQTREHLDICSLLGVRSGLVALTKTDMVESDWLDMVMEDIRENLKGTFMENAPLLPVSSATGEGLEELRSAIFQMARSIKPRLGADMLRLPVDRVFTLTGFGTVVTGTIVSGVCSQGEEIRLMPGGKTARVRNLQVHGTSVREAHQGQRCAMNLQGLEVGDIQRGDVVSRPDTLFPSSRWLARLSCLPSAPHPIRQRIEIHFHHGARECPARIIFRDRSELAPGESALAELHFPQPLAGIFGDHCVLRAHSPLRAIGGGVLIDPLPPTLRTRDPLFQQKLDMLKELADQAASPDRRDPEKITALALSLRDAPGADEKRLAVLTGLPADILAGALNLLEKSGEALCWDPASRCWIAGKSFEALMEKCVERARELHEREPLKSSFAASALCSGWGDNLPAKFTQKVLEESVKAGKLAAEGNGLKLAEYSISLDSGQLEMQDRLLEIFAKNEFAPPFIKELPAEEGFDLKKIAPLLSYLCENGKLVKVQEGLYYHRPALEKILALVREWFSDHEDLDVGGMKNILDVSRKYAIPLLEYMDASRLTCRVGDKRRLLVK